MKPCSEAGLSDSHLYSQFQSNSKSSKPKHDKLHIFSNKVLNEGEILGLWNLGIFSDDFVTRLSKHSGKCDSFGTSSSEYTRSSMLTVASVE